jgi:hypothetical protein
VSDLTLHVTVNFVLYLLAAAISAANIILMINLNPSKPYRPMRRAQLGMCALEMLTALVIATAIWYRLSSIALSLNMQFWLQTLMGANMVGTSAVTLSRVIYEIFAREPQAKATQSLIDEFKIKIRVENDTH